MGEKFRKLKYYIHMINYHFNGKILFITNIQGFSSFSLFLLIAHWRPLASHEGTGSTLLIGKPNSLINITLDNDFDFKWSKAVEEWKMQKNKNWRENINLRA